MVDQSSNIVTSDRVGVQTCKMHHCSTPFKNIFLSKNETGQKSLETILGAA